MLLSAAVAFLLASVITALELVTADYPHTYFALTPRKCPAFYIYVLSYGVIAAFVFWKLDQLKPDAFINLEGLGIDNRLGEAVAVGISIKALANIRVAQVRIGPYSLPFGLATFMIPLEGWLRDKRLALQEWNAVRYFVGPRAEKHNNITDVRDKIKRNMPPHLTDEESKALELDVDQELGSIVEIMERYLRKTGKRTFERVFPL